MTLKKGKNPGQCCGTSGNKGMYPTSKAQFESQQRISRWGEWGVFVSDFKEMNVLKGSGEEEENTKVQG